MADPDTSYYPSTDQDSAPSGGANTEREDTEDVAETALLPKSILAGKDFKPGDELVLEVVHLYDDEVEVKYASAEPEKEEEAKPSNMMSAAEEIDGMMSKG